MQANDGRNCVFAEELWPGVCEFTTRLGRSHFSVSSRRAIAEIAGESSDMARILLRADRVTYPTDPLCKRAAFSGRRRRDFRPLFPSPAEARTASHTQGGCGRAQRAPGIATAVEARCSSRVSAPLHVEIWAWFPPHGCLSRLCRPAMVTLASHGAAGSCYVTNALSWASCESPCSVRDVTADV